MAEQVLVVGPAWVGDMVMAQSLFMALKARAPSTAIDVLAPAWSQPLLARMPEVREGIELEAGHGQAALGTRWRLGRRLRTRGYAQAIVVPRSAKSALVPFAARIPRRTGYRGEMRYGLINDMRPLDRERLPQTVQRYVALAGDRGAPLPPEVRFPQLTVDTANRERLLETLGLDVAGGVVALMPGAEYGPAKQWPLEHFAELAAGLARDGRQVWIFGSEKDAPAAQRIVELSGGAATDLCGRTRLEDAVDLLSLASAAVTNDSGLMHVAAAVGAHVVAMYGSSTPAYTPPLTPHQTVHYLALDCSPCFERRCPYSHLRCLREIRPETVYESVRALSPRPRDARD